MSEHVKVDVVKLKESQRCCPMTGNKEACDVQ